MHSDMLPNEPKSMQSLNHANYINGYVASFIATAVVS